MVIIVCSQISLTSNLIWISPPFLEMLGHNFIFHYSLESNLIKQQEAFQIKL